jgi:ATPase subunit of ABC transporter with duplicated ATPase domains
MVQSRVKQLHKMEELEAPVDEAEFTMNFPPPPALRRPVITVNEVGCT